MLREGRKENKQEERREEKKKENWSAEQCLAEKCFTVFLVEVSGPSNMGGVLMTTGDCGRS